MFCDSEKSELASNFILFEHELVDSNSKKPEKMKIWSFFINPRMSVDSFFFIVLIHEKENLFLIMTF